MQSLQKEKKYKEAEELTRYINESLRRLDLRMNAIQAQLRHSTSAKAASGASAETFAPGDDASKAADSAGAAGREAARLVQEKLRQRN